MEMTREKPKDRNGCYTVKLHKVDEKTRTPVLRPSPPNPETRETPNPIYRIRSQMR